MPAIIDATIGKILPENDTYFCNNIIDIPTTIRPIVIK